MNEHFPYYLLCGMTEEEYWDRDCTLAIAFRRKDEMAQERKNEELWMQGLYVYEAIVRIAPYIRPFAKNPKVEPYLNKPHPRTTKRINDEKEQEVTTVKEQQKAKLLGWAEAVNKKMRKKNEQS